MQPSKEELWVITILQMRIVSLVGIFVPMDEQGVSAFNTPGGSGRLDGQRVAYFEDGYREPQQYKPVSLL